MICDDVIRYGARLAAVVGIVGILKCTRLQEVNNPQVVVRGMSYSLYLLAEKVTGELLEPFDVGRIRFGDPRIDESNPRKAVAAIIEQ